eukprot:s217_g22.t1
MPVNGEPWESCKDVLLVWQLAQKTDDGEFWPTALFLASPYFDSDFLDQHEVVPLFKPQVPRQPMPAKAKAGASGSNAKRAKNPKASADDAAQHIGGEELRLVEVLALGLTGIILEERQKLGGPDFLSGIETNPVVLDAVRWVVETIPKLDSRAKAVREMAFKQRERSFTEAFNELLLSCGRAHAVKVSFRVLEWMEALTVPKDSFTYEAIGVNVVKRISKLQKVWDLPQAPEDEVCPEVVFAGRSNVGKSSLVNMMLNRNALAPTSSRFATQRDMGFLHESEPMSWEQSKSVLKYVREHGIEQTCGATNADPFKWGDEVEHQVFRLIPGATGPEVVAALRSPEILAELREKEEQLQASGAEGCAWMPEFGRWMLESTPGKSCPQSLVAPTVTAFPLLGVGETQVRGPVLDSLFLPDESIFPHPRFPTLARNIRERRGGKEADALDHVYADAMPFGMGSSCLQVTMQASSIEESRRLYDQLAPLTPVLLALTAATPFLRGWICDDDVRWGQIAQSVDDRTPAERSAGSSAGDERLAGSSTTPLRKSRYDSVDCHLDQLRDAGVDEVLAKHIAHLFARDPLAAAQKGDIDHWENLQSTNWQSLRWKPPPPHKGQLSNEEADHIGWRVEFRSMELQMTDFENAAFISFIILVSRAILDLKLDLRIPMSKVEEIRFRV